MEKSTILHNVTPEQLMSLIEGCIQNQLTDLKQKFEPKTPNEYLTRKDVAEMLKINLSTIRNWTLDGTLIPYGINGRVYYKRSEVEAALVPFGKNKGTIIN